MAFRSWLDIGAAVFSFFGLVLEAINTQNVRQARRNTTGQIELIYAENVK